MGQKISDAAFQRGYQLYQNNQVSKIKQNNHLFSANVRDKQYYRVVIMINDKRKMTKMNCTCMKARKGETCEHEAAVYLKLKSEYQIFDSNEDISFKGYYENGEYDKAVEFLTNSLNKLLKQMRYDNMKQTFQALISYMNDYADMSLSPQYVIEIDSALLMAFRSFLNEEGASTYYLPWLEDILKDNQQCQLMPLIYHINMYLPSKELIPLYLAYLEEQIDDELKQNMVTYLIKHIGELTTDERLSIMQQLQNDSQDYQYMQLYQYVKENNMPQAQKLYEQCHSQLQDYDLTNIEVALYKYKGDIPSFQKYVFDYYIEADSLDDLSLVKELKDMYGPQWQSAQFEVIDTLRDIIGHIDDDILIELACYEYMAYRYLLMPHDGIAYEVLEYMRKHDLQSYLMILEEKYIYIINSSYKYKYKWISEDIKNELQSQITTEQFVEFVYDLIQYFSDSELNQELLPLIEGVSYGN